MQALKLLLCIIVTQSVVVSEKILAVFPFVGKSHFFVFQTVFVELAKRGHDVTVISQFPQPTPVERYKDINVRGVGSSAVVLNLTELGEIGISTNVIVEEVKEYITSFENVFEKPEVKSLINSNTKFDILLTEIFISDMFVGLAHRFEAQLIEMTSSVVLPWAADRFAIPDNPSYVRSYLSSGAGPMSFYDRIINTLFYITSKTIYTYFITPNDERVSEKYLGNSVPSVKEMMKETRLYLLNSHFTLNGARPFPPQVVEIGGVHIQPAKQIPQDIEKFINESEHGVVYFSLGSIANLSSMSDDMRKAFINSFAKIKQRVLWKWEVDEMPDKPDNVKIVKWMPQNDVLAHPKVKVFIGRGGLLGTMEGVYHAVPMIGIPLFADQFQNIENLVHAGMAEKLDFKHITEEAVTKALTAVLEDPKYKTNAGRMSKLFRDRPLSALDTAVYWVEYVMRHKGAHRLRTAAVNLPWYQYLLLDVIGAFVLLFVLVVYILVFVVKSVFRKLCGKKKEKVQ